MTRWRAGLICLVLSVSSAARADTFAGAANAFAATTNTYSPSVFYDAQDRLSKMWYGGWQQAGQVNDEVYYRTSSDGLTWSDYQTVLTPAVATAQYRQASGQTIPIVHVNDPTVTKLFNSDAGLYQYTMFFTACQDDCPLPPTQSRDALWSAVSTDGIHWSYAQPVGGISLPGLPASQTAPFSASSVVDSSGAPNTVWHLYFSNFGTGSNAVYRVDVDGTRTAIAPATIVFTTNDGTQAINPEVIRVGYDWYLFYNSNNAAGGYDLSYAVSQTNASWTGASPHVLLAANPPFCSLLTPGAMPLDPARYLVFFSAIKSSAGQCSGDQNHEIDLFEFVTP